MDEPLACFPDCTAQAMYGRIYAHHVDSYPSGDAGRVGPHPCSVRRARESRSAVRCLVLLFWLRPRAQTWVHRTRTLMKERAPLRVSTTSLSGCSFWNLQTQRSQHRSFELFEIHPIERPRRLVAVSVGLPCARFADSRKRSLVGGGICSCQFGPRAIHPPTLKQQAAASQAPVTWFKKRTKEGRVGGYPVSPLVVEWNMKCGTRNGRIVLVGRESGTL